LAGEDLAEGVSQTFRQMLYTMHCTSALLGITAAVDVPDNTTTKDFEISGSVV